MSIGIVIFAFNRPQLLEVSLKSLFKCHKINKFPVTIFVDGPRNNKDRELIAQTLEVIDRQKIDNLKLVISEKNKGLAQSVISGVSFVFESFDAVIVLEDDLIYSENFLEYMIISLEKYEKNYKVGSISGYSFDIGSSENNDNYFHPRPSSWGWGTWKDRWEKVSWDLNSYDTSIVNMRSFSKNGQDLPRMLKGTISGVQKSWAIRWSYKHFQYNWVCSYPFVSLVDNMGFGDDATNCKGKNKFKSSYINCMVSEWKLDDTVYINRRIKRKFNAYNSNFTKIKQRIRSLFYD
jgi:hypothetical protein